MLYIHSPSFVHHYSPPFTILLTVYMVPNTKQSAMTLNDLKDFINVQNEPLATTQQDAEISKKCFHGKSDDAENNIEVKHSEHTKHDGVLDDGVLVQLMKKSDIHHRKVIEYPDYHRYQTRKIHHNCPQRIQQPCYQP